MRQRALRRVGSCAGSAAVGTRARAAGAARRLRRCAARRGAARRCAAPRRRASTTAIDEPLRHLVADLDLHSFTTPACDDGISIDALSLSTVIRLCSTLTVSPGLTKTSITATSSKSPMSGTTTSTAPPAAARLRRAQAPAAGQRGAAARARRRLRRRAAAPSASSISSSEPSLTLSPSLTFSSFTTPACDDGISIDALSLSTVSSDCSALTVSPGLTSSSMTSTSLKSPMSGTFTSTNAMVLSPFLLLLHAYSGLILSASMPYFLIASATFAAGTAPSSASAFSAATTM